MMRSIAATLILLISFSANSQANDCITIAEQQKFTLNFRVAIKNLDANAISNLMSENPLYEKAELKNEINGFIGMLKKYPYRKKVALAAIENRSPKGKPSDCIKDFHFENKEKEDFDNAQLTAIRKNEHFNKREPKYFYFHILKKNGSLYVESINSHWWTPDEE